MNLRDEGIHMEGSEKLDTVAKCGSWLWNFQMPRSPLYFPAFITGVPVPAGTQRTPKLPRNPEERETVGGWAADLSMDHHCIPGPLGRFLSESPV